MKVTQTIPDILASNASAHVVFPTFLEWTIPGNAIIDNRDGKGRDRDVMDKIVPGESLITTAPHKPIAALSFSDFIVIKTSFFVALYHPL